MKKERIKEVISVLKNRSVTLPIIGVILFSIICAIIVSVHITPSDITVYSRYTAFGQLHFYKDHWQMSILFALFVLAVALLHSSLMIKFFMADRKLTVKAIGWMAIVIIVIATVYAVNVLSLGRSV